MKLNESQRQTVGRQFSWQQVNHIKAILRLTPGFFPRQYLSWLWVLNVFAYITDITCESVCACVFLSVCPPVCLSLSLFLCVCVSLSHTHTHTVDLSNQLTCCFTPSQPYCYIRAMWSRENPRLEKMLKGNGSADAVWTENAEMWILLFICTLHLVVL